MKLHLTATSERGKPVTKSGNERLHIAIKGYDREDIIDLIVYARTDGTIQGSLVTEKKGYNFIIDKQKTARKAKCGLSKGWDVCDELDCDHSAL